MLGNSNKSFILWIYELLDSNWILMELARMVKRMMVLGWVRLVSGTLKVYKYGCLSLCLELVGII